MFHVFINRESLEANWCFRCRDRLNVRLFGPNPKVVPMNKISNPHLEALLTIAALLVVLYPMRVSLGRDWGQWWGWLKEDGARPGGRGFSGWDRDFVVLRRFGKLWGSFTSRLGWVTSRVTQVVQSRVTTLRNTSRPADLSLIVYFHLPTSTAWW